MNRGYVRLWRKTLDSSIMKNPNALAFWSYCLLKATHKPFVALVGCQQIALEPGQFIFGRKRAAEETGLSERELRTCIALLIKLKNMTIKTTNKFSVITIVNWGFYQSEPDETTSKTTSKRPANDHIQEHKNKIIKTPFSDLLEKYAGDDRNLIDQTLQVIAQTRKTGRLSDSKKAKILQKFEKYDRQHVIAGCRTYLDKEYHRQGKREDYLFGIIRNQQAQPVPATPAFVSTGSKALDEYYRNQQTAQGAA